MQGNRPADGAGALDDADSREQSQGRDSNSKSVDPQDKAVQDKDFEDQEQNSNDREAQNSGSEVGQKQMLVAA